MTLEVWKEHLGLSDGDVLTPEYLTRRSNPKNEVVECACGCGGKRMRFDKEGKERRYIHGHHSRGTMSKEAIAKREATRFRNKLKKLEEAS